MQAIQTVESGSPAPSPGRTSPFRALLWKEWRQQRWIFLLMAGLAYAMLATAAVLFWPHRFINSESGAVRVMAAAVLSGFAAFLGIVSVVVLSANAFAGERDDETDLFLATIPCSRSKLFSVKLAFVLFLVLLGLVPLIIVGLFDLALNPNLHLQTKDIEDYALLVSAFAAGALILATVPALVASFGGSVIATILGAIPVVAACWPYIYSPFVVMTFLPVKSDKSSEWLMALYILLMLATILLAARRMWIRIERTWRTSLRTSAATAGLLIAYVVVPAAAVYLYVTLFAPLSFFLNRGDNFASGSFSAASPNGKYAVFIANYRGWGSGGATGSIKVRAALLNVDTGRTQWLSRFLDSSVWPLRGLWSPSGNQFVLDEYDMRLWPPANQRTVARATNYVVDAQTGEKRSFKELCPTLPQMSPDNIAPIGRCSEQVFALQNGRDIFFVDIEQHKFQVCKMPAEVFKMPAVIPGARRINPFRCRITPRGIFAAPDIESPRGELRVLRYAPDLAEAETLTLHNVHREYPYIVASEDGRWLLLMDFVDQRHQNVWRLAPLADGADATLLVSEDTTEQALIPSSWHVPYSPGFLPGSHQILLRGEAELGLFDADTHDLRRIPMAQARGTQIESVELSPAGRFALAWFRDPDTRDERGGRVALVDLTNGRTVSETAPIGSGSTQWLGEDRLLLEQHGRPPRFIVINRDGTAARPLLK